VAPLTGFPAASFTLTIILSEPLTDGGFGSKVARTASRLAGVCAAADDADCTAEALTLTAATRANDVIFMGSLSDLWFAGGPAEDGGSDVEPGDRAGSSLASRRRDGESVESLQVDGFSGSLAEASDVANAIIDGTDAVMLSAETAAGAFPRLAVEAMRRIVIEIETQPVPEWAGGPSWGLPVWGRSEERRERRAEHQPVVTSEEAIAAATVAAARMIATPLVIVLTKSGFSARTVASHRPGVPVLALTDDPRTYRQLALVWGVIPHLAEHAPTYEVMLAYARTAALERRLARPGDRVLVTAGVPFDVPGTTNLLKVELM